MHALSEPSGAKSDPRPAPPDRSEGPGSVSRRQWTIAILFSIAAAFAWATYYPFVLGVGRATAASAVLVYPFLSGGVAYVLWAAAHGDGRRFRDEWRVPSSGLRIGLLFGMQVSVLAATYLTGPVDASLLSLLGDVAVTPVLVAVWLVARRPQIRSPTFLLGLLLCLVGGGLAIAGGQSLQAVPPLGWTVVVAVPLAVAFFFILSARRGAEVGSVAVVAQAMVGAALLTVLLSPLLPGGWAGLREIGAVPLGLLLANGLVSFFLAPLLYFAALSRIGLVVPPMMMTGIPVFTLLLSAVLLGIAPPPVALLGVPIAVVGGLVALRSERTPTPNR